MEKEAYAREKVARLELAIPRAKSDLELNGTVGSYNYWRGVVDQHLGQVAILPVSPEMTVGCSATQATTQSETPQVHHAIEPLFHIDDTQRVE